MISRSAYIRVRYGETDQMGYVHHGNYALYFELARIELMRSIGLNYKELEDGGIMMPVLKLECNFIAPAKYDDELCIETKIKEIPTGARINFSYKITNQEGKLLTIGETELVFVDMVKNKPIRAPKFLIEKLKENDSNPE
ncbi:acyl-CoA thioesterase [Weeksellaceae bacterium TAE3-ERU29]|nr:acyl-CoA thioesterase [Weeksellaceae bacterium TAE3-ERU29]